MSKLKQSIEEMDAEIAKLVAKRSEILAEIRPLEGKNQALWNRIKTIRETMNLKRVKQNQVPWSELLEGEASGPIYKERQRRLQEIGLTGTGYFTETKQTCIQITLRKGDPESPARTLAGLKEIWPHLKPCSDGFIILKVFEDTLSEYGIYHLLITSDMQQGKRTRTTYGVQKDCTKMMKIEDLLIDTHVNCPYSDV